MTADPAELLAARLLMAFTLGSHIIVVPFGVALPVLVLIANYIGLGKHDPVALTLARRWSQVMACCLLSARSRERSYRSRWGCSGQA